MNRLCGSGESRFITHRKIVIIVSTFMLFLITRNVGAQMLNDYPEVSTPEPEMRQDPSGAFIKLKCLLKSCHGQNYIFRWEFKACGPDLPHAPKCENSDENAWAPVPENIKSEKCHSTVVIKKASASNSGVYRCLRTSMQSEEEKIVKIYQLHVVERLNIQNGAKPKLIEIQPINVTSMENSRIVIQCKVYSDYAIRPEIWWLKEIDFPSPIVNYPIPYNNKTYLKLKTSQKELGNHTYISKLIIEKSNEKDSGVYTCLAVNVFGNSDKDVLIDVVAVDKDWQGTTSLCKLFLIPLCFALIPVSVWLCVHFYRTKKLRKVQNNTNSDIYKYQPVFNLNNQNRAPINCTSQRIV